MEVEPWGPTVTVWGAGGRAWAASSTRPRSSVISFSCREICSSSAGTRSGAPSAGAGAGLPASITSTAVPAPAAPATIAAASTIPVVPSAMRASWRESVLPWNPPCRGRLRRAASGIGRRSRGAR